jgi:uncharacterized SAM-binding protein YcdF (DUF218 family)
LLVAVAKERNWRRLVLVTWGYHIGRALRLLVRAATREKTSLEVIPFPADPRIYERWPRGPRNFLPSITGWEYGSRAVRETLGQLACRLGC